MISTEHDRERDIIVVRISGQLTPEDFEHAIPELENALEVSQGPLRVKIRLEDFRGWEIGALWHQLKFDRKYGDDFGRTAVVGESALEEWGTTLSAPFTKAEMRFFPINREAEADTWLAESVDGQGGAA